MAQIQPRTRRNDILHLLDGAPVDIQTFGQKQTDGPHKGLRLLGLSGRHHVLEGHFWRNGKRFLSNDGAFIQVHVDKMSRHPGHLDSVFIGLAIGIGPGKAWQ